MPRKSANQAEAPGQDSFLDVVANLVGIMIILIMVVGIGTKKAFVAEAKASPDEQTSQAAPAAGEPAPTDEQLQRAAGASQAIESDMEEAAARLRRQQIEVAYRKAERDKLLTLLTAAEKGLDDRRSQLDERQQERLELDRRLAEARRQLEELERARLIAERAGPPPGVIEHLPTPMAKTVFGHEYHFRLGGGRLAYVPWDELVERLKADAPQKMWKLKDQSQFTESLGPVDGFVMKYTIKKVDRTMQAGGATAVQQRAELERFVLEPLAPDVGEPLERALRAESEFRDRLDRLEPAKSTITVWVYPDSYHQFRDLKRMLFERGFLAAARPLPEGHPLGASPDGSRSSAQ